MPDQHFLFSLVTQSQRFNRLQLGEEEKDGIAIWKEVHQNT